MLYEVITNIADAVKYDCFHVRPSLSKAETVKVTVEPIEQGMRLWSARGAPLESRREALRFREGPARQSVAGPRSPLPSRAFEIASTSFSSSSIDSVVSATSPPSGASAALSA